MKKWMVVALAALVVSLSVIFLAYPAKVIVSKSLLISTARPTIFRLFVQNNEWQKWWPGVEYPGDKKTSENSFQYHEHSYVITLKNFNSVEIAILKANDTLAKTSLFFIEQKPGSIQMQWNGLLKQPLFGREKVKQNLEADFAELLKKMQVFFEDNEKVYEIPIKLESVKDTALISTFDTSRGYPSTAVIYGLIDKLKHYSTSQGATISGYPMLNVFTKDSVVYQVKVALPLNKKLSSKENIEYKWMLPHGYILVSEIQGPPSKVDLAFQQLELYVKENKLVPPAIPFYSLVTDRSMEPDSSRWITRIYYPVMD